MKLQVTTISVNDQRADYIDDVIPLPGVAFIEVLHSARCYWFIVPV